MPQLIRKHEKRKLHLSDEDVEVLYDIVSRAEARASTTHRPLAALWNIYDSTFANVEFDDEVDKRYFDFLVNFSLSEFRERPLLETFRALLREQNIILKDSDELQTQEAENELADGGRRGDSSGEYEDEWHRPRRRASFTSIYDTTREIERQLEPRTLSRASVSKLDIDHSILPVPDQSRKWTREQLENPAQARWPVAQSSTYNFRKSSYVNPDEGHAKSALERNAKAARNATYLENDFSEASSDESFPASSEGGDRHDPYQHPLDLPELLNGPTNVRLVRCEDAFSAQRETRLLRRALGQWSKRALNLVMTLYHWEYRAVEVDRKKLLTDAMSTWRRVHHRKAQEVKVERLFEHLSQRADLARDLYLMGRVLSHWLVTAAKRVEETHVARRHLLRLKYFNAWRDITVTQELKAQRLGVMRPFRTLIRKYGTNLEDQVRALDTYHHNLTRIVFYRWFWGPCAVRAPQYRDRHLKKDALMYWSQKLRMHGQQQYNADCMFRRRVRKRAFSTWAQKTRIDLAGNHQADGFRKSHLTRSTLKNWLLKTKLTPPTRQVSRMQDWRIARTFFTSWLQKARMCIKANAVNYLRLKQSAWTAWNDALRVKALTSQISERLYSQALYQWVLAQRAILLKRTYDRRIAKETMQRLMTTFREKHRHWNQQEIKVVRKQRQALLRSTFGFWMLRINLQREQEGMAVEFDAHRAQQTCLYSMRNTLAHTQEMYTRAGHAEFFFLTMKAIKRWHLATAESQKRRRQDAYARTRRQIKINLARRMLSAWCTRVNNLQGLHHKALDTRRARDLSTLSRHFSTWHSRMFLIHQESQHASEKKDGNLRMLTLQSWSEKRKRNWLLEDRAAQVHDIHMSAVCSTLIRRISLRTFKIRRMEADADAMRDRHWGKHVRNILRHWAERAAGEAISDDSPTARRARHIQPEDDVTQRQVQAYAFSEPHEVEEWTALEDDVDFVDRASLLISTRQPLAAQTNTPRYLSTPSKRVAKARALANISTTPGTPSRTPFAARVRAEMLGQRETQTAPPKLRREGTGPSNLGQHVSFSDEAREK